MRIIAGKYRSRKISLPKGSAGESSDDSLRPTSDRARETLFDVLANIVDFENAACLDLFAGTGALGFEAISRGAESVVFVDFSRKNLDAIKSTAAELACAELISVFKDDALHYLKESSGKTFDFIFADPPYDYAKYSELTETALKIQPMLFVLETSSVYSGTFTFTGYDMREKKVGAAKFSIFISK
jgi:16S rRNA (guanine966-N2)-methyltransferase